MDALQRRYIEAMIRRDTVARGGPPEALVEARGMGFGGRNAAPPGPMTGDPLHDVGDEALETISLTEHRPACLITGDVPTLSSLPRRWWNLHVHVDPLTQAARAVGRITVPNDPNTSYGSGFLAAPGVLLTSRRVATAFVARASGRDVSLSSPAAVDFRRERGAPFRPPLVLRVERALAIHPRWDLAALAVEPTDEIAPLALARAPSPPRSAVVALVGHPAPSTEERIERRILHRSLGYKHLAPGRIVGQAPLPTVEGPPAYLLHDCSTVADWSGAPLVDVATGEVVGIHSTSRYLQGGWAVPASELAGDRLLSGLGLFRRRRRHKPSRPAHG